MSRTTFSIAYDGPELRAGTMNVRDVAPALLAVGQLFDAGNSVLNGQETKISVNVKATDEGSFEVFLDLVQTLTNRILEFIKSEDVTTALRLKELLLIGGGGGGLLVLLRKLRGKKPEKIERISSDQVRITVDSETFDVPIKLLRLYKDIAVRTALKNIVAPLSQEGIDTFKASDGKETETIEKDEVSYFQTPELVKEVLVEQTDRAAFSIVSVTFREANKWRLNDGNADINVSMNDEAFLTRVGDSRVAFAKGDILICEVRKTQIREGVRLRSDFVVERVVEHIPAARQIEWEFAPDSEGSDSGANS